jgi:predicted nucleic acid-binding protein
MKVFIDSNYFIALYNPQDKLHEQATTLAIELTKQNPQVYISTFTFIEITTVISQRVGRIASIEAGKELLNSDDFSFIHGSKELEKRSWEIFQDVSQKNVSFVDCSIIAAMKFEDIPTLITFDKKDFNPLQRKYKFSLYETEL